LEGAAIEGAWTGCSEGIWRGALPNMARLGIGWLPENGALSSIP
jgi:hypothetical protein